MMTTRYALRSLTALALLFSLAGASCAQSGDGVKFHESSWAELTAKAKKDGKPFFVDFWASWCGPCRMLNQTTFKDKAVAEYANRHFVPSKMSIEQEEGKMISNKYGVRSIPTIIFFSPQGQEIGRVVGYKDAEGFLQEMQKYGGKRGDKAGRRTKNDASVEFAGATTNDYLKAKSANAQRVYEALGFDPALQAQLDAAHLQGEKKDEFAYEDKRKEIAAGRADMVWLADVHYALGAKDFEKVVEIVEARRKEAELSPVALHWLAWQFHAQEEIPHEPMRWINAALRAGASYDALDTKAYLYFRSGKLDLAREVCEEARKAARESQQEDTQTRILQALIGQSL